MMGPVGFVLFCKENMTSFMNSPFNTLYYIYVTLYLQLHLQLIAGWSFMKMRGQRGEKVPSWRHWGITQASKRTGQFNWIPWWLLYWWWWYIYYDACVSVCLSRKIITSFTGLRIVKWIFLFDFFFEKFFFGNFFWKIFLWKFFEHFFF